MSDSGRHAVSLQTMVRQRQQVVIAEGTAGMAINEIVLVAYGNGHGHVVIRWGHSLLRKIRERREMQVKMRIRHEPFREKKDTKRQGV